MLYCKQLSVCVKYMYNIFICIYISLLHPETLHDVTIVGDLWRQKFRQERNLREFWKTGTLNPDESRQSPFWSRFISAPGILSTLNAITRSSLSPETSARSSSRLLRSIRELQNDEWNMKLRSYPERACLSHPSFKKLLSIHRIKLFFHSKLTRYHHIIICHNLQKIFHLENCMRYEFLFSVIDF